MRTDETKQIVLKGDGMDDRVLTIGSTVITVVVPIAIPGQSLFGQRQYCDSGERDAEGRELWRAKSPT